jgi:hypothetical protein
MAVETTTGDQDNYAELFKNMLEPGEKIIWAGRPRQDATMPLNLKSTLFAVLGAVFCILFMITVYILAISSIYRLIGIGAGLFFFAVSVYMMFNQVGGGFMARKKAYYALTNKRALALFQHNVPALVSVKYKNMGTPRLRLKGSGRGNIYLGDGTLTFTGIKQVPGSKRPFELTFEDVEHAQAVYDQICGQSHESRWA